MFVLDTENSVRPDELIKRKTKAHYRLLGCIELADLFLIFFFFGGGGGGAGGGRGGRVW